MDKARLLRAEAQQAEAMLRWMESPTLAWRPPLVGRVGQIVCNGAGVENKMRQLRDLASKAEQEAAAIARAQRGY